MKQISALNAKDKLPLVRSMILWAVKVLTSELGQRPVDMFKTLRRFDRLCRATLMVSEHAKIMQFGSNGNGECWKSTVYIPRWPSRAIETRARRAMRTDHVWPEQVTLSITDRCPYKCRHCSNARAQSKPMPLSRLVEVVRELQEMGGSWLNIGGGEPGVDFERALAAVEAADERSETWLNTTGFGLDDEKAKRYKQAGLFGGRVSIHSHKPDEYDDFVGYRGAFKIAAEAIQTFRRADIFPVISAAMPEVNITWNKVQDIVQMGKDLGAGFVEIIPIRPAGRAIIQCSHSELCQHGLNQQIFEVFNTDEKFANYPAVNSVAYLETPDKFGCIAGAERLYISASGDVQPCPLVNLSLGNVMQQDLATICECMRSLVQGPRSELLCSQLGPLISDYLAKAGNDCDILPINPEKSVEILENLPASTTPKVWKLRFS